MSDTVLGTEEDNDDVDNHNEVVVAWGEKLMTNKFIIYSMTFTLFTQANFRFFQI